MRNAELNEMSYLTRSPISLDALLAEVSSAACGGTCLFLGTVRNGPEEQGVTAIEYSAYEEMVEAEFGRLLADAEGRWPEARSEEHTSELQSHSDLVCRLLLEKK